MSAAFAVRLGNVQLPDKIRCQSCNRWKGHVSFSNKRLNEVRRMVLAKRIQPTAKCVMCVPVQVVELVCCMCGKTKSLDDFAKAQRKNGDHAKCTMCMQEQLKTATIENRSVYHGEDITASDLDESDDSDDEDGYPSEPMPAGAEFGFELTNGNLIGEFDSMTMSDSTSTASSHDFWTPAPNRTLECGTTATAWSTGVQAWASGSAASVSSMSDTSIKGGLGPKTYGHPRTWSLADSMETNRPTSNTSSKWAKVKAHKPNPEKEETLEENAWGEADEESSSSDEDSDDEYTT